MKKNIWRTAISLVIVFSLMLAMVGCSTVAFKITVTDGTGSGTFDEGKECTVTATIPAGKVFVNWTIDGLEVSKANPYTFKVEKDADLKATFADAVMYTVNVKGGKINGANTASVVANSQVTVTASTNQARRFVKWIVNEVDASTANPYTFTAVGNTEVAAVFDEICLVSVDGGTVNSKQSARFDAGESATVIADAAPAGQGFGYWYTLDAENEEVILSTEASYTFVVSESIKIYAKNVLTFLVTVTDGYIGTPGTSSSYVAEYSKCTVTANAVPDGKDFIGWYSSENVLISTANPFTFTVTEAATLVAKYDTVTNKTLETPDNSEDKLYYREANGAIAIDRIKGNPETIFESNVQYIEMFIYNSTTANTATDSLGSFKMAIDPDSTSTERAGWISTLDGTIGMHLKGGSGNYYIDVNLETFIKIITTAVGTNYNPNYNYYLAGKAVAYENALIEDGKPVKYTSSGISQIGKTGFPKR